MANFEIIVQYISYILFLIGPGMEGTGPKLFLWEKVQAQQRSIFSSMITIKIRKILVMIEKKYNSKRNLSKLLPNDYPQHSSTIFHCDKTLIKHHLCLLYYKIEITTVIDYHGYI